MRTKEYIEGFNSFRNNNGSYQNPYLLGSSKRIDFEAGWTQAIRKEPKSSFKNGKFCLSDEINSNEIKRSRVRLREYSKK